MQPNYYVVRDANRQQLAYIYFENEPGRRSAAKLVTKNEARGEYRQAAGAFAQNVTRRPNAAEWVASTAGWNFECKTRSPADLPDTAESWRRRSVANPHPLALDTTAHFEPARHSHLGFRRQQE